MRELTEIVQMFRQDEQNKIENFKTCILALATAFNGEDIDLSTIAVTLALEDLHKIKASKS